MNDKPVLMIHEVTKDVLTSNIKFEDYVLTFDDALYSQYFYWPVIKKIETKKILFVPTGLIQDSKLQRPKVYTADGVVRYRKKKFPTCYEAMEMWERQSNNVAYMTVGELKALIKDGLDIGGHGHQHIRFYPDNLVDFIKAFKIDVEQMLLWFEDNLDIRPISYCFNFNREMMMMRKILELEYGFTSFYGEERVDIEDLLWSSGKKQ